MASTNFVVHLVAAIALLITFYVIARYNAQVKLLKDLFVYKSSKRLVDPYKLYMSTFDFYEIDFSYEKISSSMKLINLSRFGRLIASLDPLDAHVGTNIEMTVKAAPENIDQITKELVELTGIEIEIKIEN